MTRFSRYLELTGLLSRVLDSALLDLAIFVAVFGRSM